MKTFIVIAALLVSAIALEESRTSTDNTSQEDERQSRKPESPPTMVQQLRMRQEQDARESEVQEQTYIERIGSQYCPLADGRNVFQNSCSR